MAPIRRCRRIDELQLEARRGQSAHGRLRRPHPEGGCPRRFAGRATNPLRAGHQPGDRKGARPDDPTHGVAARRRGHRMKRRDLLLLATSAAALPVIVDAQRPRRIGYLRLAPSDATQLADFRAGLEETGYAEGRNLVIEYRYAEGDYARLPDLAADLVRQNVEVIVTSGGTD